MDTSVPDAETIAEVDRRLNRENLTALDRAQLIARRKKLYDRLHPKNESSGPSGSKPEEDA